MENIQQKIFTRSSFEFAYRFPKIKSSAFHKYYPPELANRFFDTLTVQKGLSKILIGFPAAFLQIIFGFSLKESKIKYKVAHWIQEIARSLVSFKLSGKTSLAMSRNDKLTTEYLVARENHFKVLILQYIQMIGFKILVTSGLLIIGGLLVLNQQMNIGQFVASEIIILSVINSVEKLITGLETFYDVLTSLEKIGQVVDRELEPQSGFDPFEGANSLSVEVENLSYHSMEGQSILSDVNFNIKSEDRILLSGKSGSGKTTLLKMLSGLITPSSGTLYVNETSMKGIWPNQYRISIGQVLPEQHPFEGTIIENITFGDTSVPIERLNSVLKNVGLFPFIKRQPKGLNAMLYPEGQHIPYTITRRIVLARAIINEPQLLLLKDPLDHFEVEEAERIIKYLTDESQPWALVVASKNDLWKRNCNREISVTGENLKN